MAGDSGEFVTENTLNSTDSNVTLHDDIDYMNVDHHLPKNMELPREFIYDYEEYMSVLKDCNRTIHSTPYPRDGEYNLFNVFNTTPVIQTIGHSPSSPARHHSQDGA